MASREDEQGTQAAIPPEQGESVRVGFEEPGEIIVTEGKKGLRAAERRVVIERQRFLPSADLTRDIEGAVKAANGFIDVPQASPAATEDEDRLEPLRAVIGDRVEKIIANVGFRASARESQSYRVAEGGRFCHEMRTDLERAFSLGSAAEGILVRLEGEVRAFAKGHDFEGAWGRLVADDLGLAIVTKKLERAPDRPQAQVVGGRAFESLKSR
jgi:hypothetical protein